MGVVCDGNASESVIARYFDPKLGRFLTQDSFLGQIDEPPSLHRYAYGFNNPFVYIDPDGNVSVRQAWGLDEPQGFWSAFGKNVAYNAWNVISLGTLGRQDTLVEQYEAGLISDNQYWGRTAINAGSSVAIGVAAAATGGVAGVAASSLGAGAVATGAIAGAAAGIGGQAATDILEVGVLETKSFEDVSATDYLIAGGGGALFGGLAGKAYAGSRPAVSPRTPARQPATTAPKATTVVETAHPPKALPAGRQPRALIGPPGDPGLTGASTRSGARFIADADGNVLDLATGRGRPNVVGSRGPTPLASGRQVTAAEYASLRRATPNQAAREFVNPPTRGPRLDPVYRYPVKRLQADHVVSMKETTQMYGFSDLPRNKMIEILNLRRNLMGLGGRSNASKGATSWGTWRGHSRLGPVPRSLRQRMLEEERLFVESCG